MVPDSTQMAQAGQLITDSFSAFALLGVILALIVITTAGPIVVRMFRRALGGGR